MERSRPTFRFAPSPTGELHIGHALSAMNAWHWARRLDGRFLLRIEDIDVGRSRAHFVDQIFDDLRWLGFDWETPVRRQSEHFDAYRAQAQRLEAMGLLYPCFATRREIADAVAKVADHPTDPDGAPLYPHLHKHMASREVEDRKAAGQPLALRLDLDRALAAARQINGNAPITYTSLDGHGAHQTVTAQPERWGDAVIVRKDVPASYHLAVVTDDASQGVSHVTRGRDLRAATDLHRLLQTLLGLPAPLYHHHRLILDDGGAKFSKRRGAVSLRALREAGASRDDVLQMVGDIFG
ncbi:MAG: tRNA glutamyl-Q(34) synthetase GluQRS [Hyphomicrobiaceae bacterium]